jgi:serine/threonine protein phosphatase Stp1
LALVLAVASIFGGLTLAIGIDDQFGPQMLDWFRESLGAVVIFPILMLVALVANRILRGNGIRVGAKPLIYGASALLGGLGLTAAVLLATLLMGDAKIIAPFAIPAAIGPFLWISALFLIQSASEEVFFRGWLQGSLEHKLRPALAIVVTAVLFAALHYVVEPRHPMSAVNLLLAGIVLGLIYRLTKGLVAPTLFHFGWNWAEAMGLGLTPNPGKYLAGTLSDFDLTGPLLFGGGDEGLNTSVISAAVLALVGIVLLWVLNRKPKAVKPIDVKSIDSKLAPLPGKADILAANAAARAAAEPTTLQMADTPAGKVPVAPLAIVQPVVAPPPPLVAAETVDAVATLAATHPGAVRQVNEDRYYTDEAAGLWAVADGMGGHRFGDRASTMIVETLAPLAPVAGLEQKIALTSEAILDANRAIYLEAQENGSRMGSTVVALVIDGDKYALIWAGDSRAYRLRGGALEQLSRDHTQVQELVDKGEMTPAQAARHPMSHVLVKAIGVIEGVELEVMRGEIEAGDIFFLCSDGIYDALDDDEIAERLIKRGADTNLDPMINLAVAQGAKDNVTAIAIVPDNLKHGQAKTEGSLNS